MRTVVWYSEDTINVELPDGQILQFPAREPGRFVAYLRNEDAREKMHQHVNTFRWPGDPEWDRKVAERMAEIRAKTERELKKRREKKAKQMSKAEANKILEDVGL